MAHDGGKVNLVMSGGGIKGIAYVGMCDVAERRGHRWGNISGVSAGALIGSFMASGFSAYEMWKSMAQFDFVGIQMENIASKVPVVAAYREYLNQTRLAISRETIMEFFNKRVVGNRGESTSKGQAPETFRGTLLGNIGIYSKYGCLFDGDYLEEWVSGMLARKGIRTFGDLRTGKVDSANPGGYKLRVTGVDLNRAKLVVLPDDARDYGIEPDQFEVAKAVRVSTCVPFAFKPVELKVKEGNLSKIHSLVDGGVFDRFPYWLVDNNKQAIGFKLSGGEKPSFLSIDTPLNIFKSIISTLQDIGVPKDIPCDIKYIGEIDTTKVHFLDFNLSEEDKEYLFNAGRQTAILTFNKFEGKKGRHRGFRFPFFRV